MNKESKYLLHKVDCNCNDCGFLERDLTKIPKGTSYPILSGKCTFLNKIVTFIPNLCQLNTQECFKHRLDFISEEERNNKLNIIKTTDYNYLNIDDLNEHFLL